MAKEESRKAKKNPIGAFLKALGKDIAEIGTTLIKGDWKTKISFVIMGFGQLARGQFLRGLMYLAVEAALLFYIIKFGWSYLSKLGTLGTVETGKVGRVTVYGDNSFLILLFGIP